MNATLLVILIGSLSACATVPALTCSRLIAELPARIGAPIVVEATWHRGWHGSWVCSSLEPLDRKVIQLDGIPEHWLDYLNQPTDGEARVRVCGTLLPPPKEIQGIAATSIGLIRVDPSCSAIQDHDGTWRK